MYQSAIVLTKEAYAYFKTNFPMESMHTISCFVELYEYVCKPSLFINSKNSIFYNENKDICQFECDFISSTQEADGTWDIIWAWDEYPEQWCISKNWWKSDLIIKNLKFYNEIRKI